jgi:small subunit ribosomal protein S9
MVETETNVQVAPAPPAQVPWTWSVGRRKSAVARVRIRPGSGKFLINKREVDEYFPREVDRLAARKPLVTAKAEGQWDIYVNVKGGGLTGQSGAVLLGVARALIKAAPATSPALRDQDLLTRDAREVERKKPGRRKARRSFQFSKR